MALDDLGFLRFAATGGDSVKGGTVLVEVFVLGFGARGGFANGRGLEEEDGLEAGVDLVLVLLMFANVG